MSIEVNGVTLPDIPEDVLASYPYAVILDASGLSALSYEYIMFCRTLPHVVLPAELTGNDYDLLTHMGDTPEGRNYGGVANQTEWVFLTDDISDSMQFALGDGEGFVSISWANYDVQTITGADDSGFLYADEPYFPSSVSDPNYYAPKSWFDGMARQVMRLTGTSDTMTTDKMLELAKGVEVGGGGSSGFNGLYGVYANSGTGTIET